MAEHYIERKHGREPVTYPHPLMQTTLADTYGIILYQEQIMQLARELAGYSLGQADLLRRAMGKKNPEEMAQQRDIFISGSTANGIALKVANEIFDQMETFARYGFNRSHSAAYAMISFQTGYLKAHYGVEFMAALMSNELDDTDKVLKNLNECRKQGVMVLPPDVNSSMAGFSVSDGKIRYGLSAVKGIGEKAVESIRAEREKDGPYKDLEDFAARVDLRTVNRRVVESLIKCGAFDFANVSRNEMIERLDDVLKFAQAQSREQSSNQISLFDAAAISPSIARRSTNRPEWPINKKLAMEREALGFYISGHPVIKFRRVLKQMGATTTEEVRQGARNAEVKIGGVITALRLKNTKKGDRYATFALEDWLGSIESIVWPDTYVEIAHLMILDEPVVVSGRADITDERCNLIVSKVESLISWRDRNATQGLLALAEEDYSEQKLTALFGVFGRYGGKCPVRLRLDKEHWIALKDRSDVAVCVAPSEALCDEIEQLFGKPILSFV
jgi:DNA polymerase-3 subunit alpha